MGNVGAVSLWVDSYPTATSMDRYMAAGSLDINRNRISVGKQLNAV